MKLTEENLEKALDKACKLLKKAGVVAYKENGKPVRLSAEKWKEFLCEI